MLNYPPVNPVVSHDSLTTPANGLWLPLVMSFEIKPKILKQRKDYIIRNCGARRAAEIWILGLGGPSAAWLNHGPASFLLSFLSTLGLSSLQSLQNSPLSFY